MHACRSTLEDPTVVGHVQEQQLQRAALVAGGFHTPGITDGLRAAGIGYAVIAPKVSGPADESGYARRLEQTLPSVIELIRRLHTQALAPPLETAGPPNLPEVLDFVGTKSEALLRTLRMVDGLRVAPAERVRVAKAQLTTLRFQLGLPPRASLTTIIATLRLRLTEFGMWVRREPKFQDLPIKLTVDAQAMRATLFDGDRWWVLDGVQPPRDSRGTEPAPGFSPSPRLSQGRVAGLSRLLAASMAAAALLIPGAAMGSPLISAATGGHAAQVWSQYGLRWAYENATGRVFWQPLGQGGDHAWHLSHHLAAGLHPHASTLLTLPHGAPFADVLGAAGPALIGVAVVALVGIGVAWAWPSVQRWRERAAQAWAARWAATRRMVLASMAALTLMQTGLPMAQASVSLLRVGRTVRRIAAPSPRAQQFGLTEKTGDGSTLATIAAKVYAEPDMSTEDARRLGIALLYENRQKLAAFGLPSNLEPSEIERLSPDEIEALLRAPLRPGKEVGVPFLTHAAKRQLLRAGHAGNVAFGDWRAAWEGSHEIALAARERAIPRPLSNRSVTPFAPTRLTMSPRPLITTPTPKLDGQLRQPVAPAAGPRPLPPTGDPITPEISGRAARGSSTPRLRPHLTTPAVPSTSVRPMAAALRPASPSASPRASESGGTPADLRSRLTTPSMRPSQHALTASGSVTAVAPMPIASEIASIPSTDARMTTPSKPVPPDAGRQLVPPSLLRPQPPASETLSLEIESEIASERMAAPRLNPVQALMSDPRTSVASRGSRSAALRDGIARIEAANVPDDERAALQQQLLQRLAQRVAAQDGAYSDAITALRGVFQYASMRFALESTKETRDVIDAALHARTDDDADQRQVFLDQLAASAELTVPNVPTALIVEIGAPKTRDEFFAVISRLSKTSTAGQIHATLQQAWTYLTNNPEHYAPTSVAMFRQAAIQRALDATLAQPLTFRAQLDLIGALLRGRELTPEDRALVELVVEERADALVDANRIAEATATRMITALMSQLSPSTGIGVPVSDTPQQLAARFAATLKSRRPHEGGQALRGAFGDALNRLDLLPESDQPAARRGLIQAVVQAVAGTSWKFSERMDVLHGLFRFAQDRFGPLDNDELALIDQTIRRRVQQLGRDFGQAVSADRQRAGLMTALQQQSRNAASAQARVPERPALLRRVGTWLSPLPGALRLISWFGASREGGRRRHEGVDLAARAGTPVGAIKEGVVAVAGYVGKYGLVIYINHPDGSQSRYAHLRRKYVREGDRITGDRLRRAIGEVGQTGNARFTGPHLHFEFRPSLRRPLNPWPMLARAVLWRGRITPRLAQRHGVGRRLRSMAKPIRSRAKAIDAPAKAKVSSLPSESDTSSDRSAAGGAGSDDGVIPDVGPPTVQPARTSRLSMFARWAAIASLSWSILSPGSALAARGGFAPSPRRHSVAARVADPAVLAMARRALRSANALQNGPTVKRGTAQRGAWRARVKAVQTALRWLGYPLTPDGRFGSRTAAAIVDFQRRHGLKDDGIVGRGTRLALRRALWSVASTGRRRETSGTRQQHAPRPPAPGSFSPRSPIYRWHGVPVLPAASEKTNWIGRKLRPIRKVAKPSTPKPINRHMAKTLPIAATPQDSAALVRLAFDWHLRQLRRADLPVVNDGQLSLALVWRSGQQLLDANVAQYTDGQLRERRVTLLDAMLDSIFARPLPLMAQIEAVSRTLGDSAQTMTAEQRARLQDQLVGRVLRWPEPDHAVAMTAVSTLMQRLAPAESPAPDVAAADAFEPVSVSPAVSSPTTPAAAEDMSTEKAPMRGMSPGHLSLPLLFGLGFFGGGGLLTAPVWLRAMHWLGAMSLGSLVVGVVSTSFFALAATVISRIFYIADESPPLAIVDVGRDEAARTQVIDWVFSAPTQKRLSHRLNVALHGLPWGHHPMTLEEIRAVHALTDALGATWQETGRGAPPESLLDTQQWLNRVLDPSLWLGLPLWQARGLLVEARAFAADSSQRPRALAAVEEGMRLLPGDQLRALQANLSVPQSQRRLLADLTIQTQTLQQEFASLRDELSRPAPSRFSGGAAALVGGALALLAARADAAGPGAMAPAQIAAWLFASASWLLGPVLALTAWRWAHRLRASRGEGADAERLLRELMPLLQNRPLTVRPVALLHDGDVTVEALRPTGTDIYVLVRAPSIQSPLIEVRVAPQRGMVWYSSGHDAQTVLDALRGVTHPMLRAAMAALDLSDSSDLELPPLPSSTTGDGLLKAPVDRLLTEIGSIPWGWAEVQGDGIEFLVAPQGQGHAIAVRVPGQRRTLATLAANPNGEVRVMRTQPTDILSRGLDGAADRYELAASLRQTLEVRGSRWSNARPGRTLTPPLARMALWAIASLALGPIAVASIGPVPTLVAIAGALLVAVGWRAPPTSTAAVVLDGPRALVEALWPASLALRIGLAWATRNRSRDRLHVGSSGNAPKKLRRAMRDLIDEAQAAAERGDGIALGRLAEAARELLGRIRPLSTKTTLQQLLLNLTMVFPSRRGLAFGNESLGDLAEQELVANQRTLLRRIRDMVPGQSRLVVTSLRSFLSEPDELFPQALRLGVPAVVEPFRSVKTLRQLLERVGPGLQYSVIPGVAGRAPVIVLSYALSEQSQPRLSAFATASGRLLDVVTLTPADLQRLGLLRDPSGGTPVEPPKLATPPPKAPAARIMPQDVGRLRALMTIALEEYGQQAGRNRQEMRRIASLVAPRAQEQWYEELVATEQSASMAELGERTLAWLEARKPSVASPAAVPAEPPVADQAGPSASEPAVEAEGASQEQPPAVGSSEPVSEPVNETRAGEARIEVPPTAPEPAPLDASTIASERQRMTAALEVLGRRHQLRDGVMTQLAQALPEAVVQRWHEEVGQRPHGRGNASEAFGRNCFDWLMRQHDLPRQPGKTLAKISVLLARPDDLVRHAGYGYGRVVHVGLVKEDKRTVRGLTLQTEEPVARAEEFDHVSGNGTLVTLSRERALQRLVVYGAELPARRALGNGSQGPARAALVLLGLGLSMVASPAHALLQHPLVTLPDFGLFAGALLAGTMLPEVVVFVVKHLGRARLGRSGFAIPSAGPVIMQTLDSVPSDASGMLHRIPVALVDPGQSRREAWDVTDRLAVWLRAKDMPGIVRIKPHTRLDDAISRQRLELLIRQVRPARGPVTIVTTISEMRSQSGLAFLHQLAVRSDVNLMLMTEDPDTFNRVTAVLDGGQRPALALDVRNPDGAQEQPESTAVRRNAMLRDAALSLVPLPGPIGWVLLVVDAFDVIRRYFVSPATRSDGQPSTSSDREDAVDQSGPRRGRGLGGPMVWMAVAGLGLLTALTAAPAWAMPTKLVHLVVGDWQASLVANGRTDLLTNGAPFHRLVDSLAGGWSSGLRDQYAYALREIATRGASHHQIFGYTHEPITVGLDAVGHVTRLGSHAAHAASSVTASLGTPELVLGAIVLSALAWLGVLLWRRGKGRSGSTRAWKASLIGLAATLAATSGFLMGRGPVNQAPQPAPARPSIRVSIPRPHAAPTARTRSRPGSHARAAKPSPPAGERVRPDRSARRASERPRGTSSTRERSQELVVELPGLPFTSRQAAPPASAGAPTPLETRTMPRVDLSPRPTAPGVSNPLVAEAPATTEAPTIAQVPAAPVSTWQQALDSFTPKDVDGALSKKIRDAMAMIVQAPADQQPAMTQQLIGAIVERDLFKRSGHFRDNTRGFLQAFGSRSPLKLLEPQLDALEAKIREHIMEDAGRNVDFRKDLAALAQLMKTLRPAAAVKPAPAAAKPSAPQDLPTLLASIKPGDKAEALRHATRQALAMIAREPEASQPALRQQILDAILESLLKRPGHFRDQKSGYEGALGARSPLRLSEAQLTAIEAKIRDHIMEDAGHNVDFRKDLATLGQLMASLRKAQAPPAAPVSQDLPTLLASIKPGDTSVMLRQVMRQALPRIAAEPAESQARWRQQLIDAVVDSILARHGAFKTTTPGFLSVFGPASAVSLTDDEVTALSERLRQHLAGQIRLDPGAQAENRKALDQLVEALRKASRSRAITQTGGLGQRATAPQVPAAPSTASSTPRSSPSLSPRVTVAPPTATLQAAPASASASAANQSAVSSFVGTSSAVAPPATPRPPALLHIRTLINPDGFGEYVDLTVPMAHGQQLRSRLTASGNTLEGRLGWKRPFQWHGAPLTLQIVTRARTDRSRLKEAEGFASIESLLLPRLQLKLPLLGPSTWKVSGGVFGGATWQSGQEQGRAGALLRGQGQIGRLLVSGEAAYDVLLHEFLDHYFGSYDLMQVGPGRLKLFVERNRLGPLMRQLIGDKNAWGVQWERRNGLGLELMIKPGSWQPKPGPTSFEVGVKLPINLSGSAKPATTPIAAPAPGPTSTPALPPASPRPPASLQIRTLVNADGFGEYVDVTVPMSGQQQLRGRLTANGNTLEGRLGWKGPFQSIHWNGAPLTVQVVTREKIDRSRVKEAEGFAAIDALLLPHLKLQLPLLGPLTGKVSGGVFGGASWSGQEQGRAGALLRGQGQIGRLLVSGEAAYDVLLKEFLYHMFGSYDLVQVGPGRLKLFVERNRFGSLMRQLVGDKNAWGLQWERRNGVGLELMVKEGAWQEKPGPTTFEVGLKLPINLSGGSKPAAPKRAPRKPPVRTAMDLPTLLASITSNDDNEALRHAMRQARVLILQQPTESQPALTQQLIDTVADAIMTRRSSFKARSSALQRVLGQRATPAQPSTTPRATAPSEPPPAAEAHAAPLAAGPEAPAPILRAEPQQIQAFAQHLLADVDRDYAVLQWREKIRAGLTLIAKAWPSQQAEFREEFLKLSTMAMMAQPPLTDERLTPQGLAHKSNADPLWAFDGRLDRVQQVFAPTGRPLAKDWHLTPGEVEVMHGLLMWEANQLPRDPVTTVVDRAMRRNNVDHLRNELLRLNADDRRGSLGPIGPRPTWTSRGGAVAMSMVNTMGIYSIAGGLSSLVGPSVVMYLPLLIGAVFFTLPLLLQKLQPQREERATLPATAKIAFAVIATSFAIANHSGLAVLGLGLLHGKLLTVFGLLGTLASLFAPELGRVARAVLARLAVRFAPPDPNRRGSFLDSPWLPVLMILVPTLLSFAATATALAAVPAHSMSLDGRIAAKQDLVDVLRQRLHAAHPTGAAAQQLILSRPTGAAAHRHPDRFITEGPVVHREMADLLAYWRQRCGGCDDSQLDRFLHTQLDALDGTRNPLTGRVYRIGFRHTDLVTALRDGRYGTADEALVLAYQRQHHLREDGDWGVRSRLSFGFERARLRLDELRHQRRVTAPNGTPAAAALRWPSFDALRVPLLVGLIGGLIFSASRWIRQGKRVRLNASGLRDVASGLLDVFAWELVAAATGGTLYFVFHVLAYGAPWLGSLHQPLVFGLAGGALYLLVRWTRQAWRARHMTDEQRLELDRPRQATDDPVADQLLEDWETLLARPLEPDSLSQMLKRASLMIERYQFGEATLGTPMRQAYGVQQQVGKMALRTLLRLDRAADDPSLDGHREKLQTMVRPFVDRAASAFMTLSDFDSLRNAEMMGSYFPPSTSHWNRNPFLRFLSSISRHLFGMTFVLDRSWVELFGPRDFGERVLLRVHNASLFGWKPFGAWMSGKIDRTIALGRRLGPGLYRDADQIKAVAAQRFESFKVQPETQMGMEPEWGNRRMDSRLFPMLVGLWFFAQRLSDYWALHHAMPWLAFGDIVFRSVVLGFGLSALLSWYAIVRGQQHRYADRALDFLSRRYGLDGTAVSGHPEDAMLRHEFDRYLDAARALEAAPAGPSTQFIIVTSRTPEELAALQDEVRTQIPWSRKLDLTFVSQRTPGSVETLVDGLHAIGDPDRPAVVVFVGPELDAMTPKPLFNRFDHEPQISPMAWALMTGLIGIDDVNQRAATPEDEVWRMTVFADSPYVGPIAAKGALSLVGTWVAPNQAEAQGLGVFTLGADESVLQFRENKYETGNGNGHHDAASLSVFSGIIVLRQKGGPLLELFEDIDAQIIQPRLADGRPVPTLSVVQDVLIPLQRLSQGKSLNSYFGGPHRNVMATAYKQFYSEWTTYLRDWFHANWHTLPPLDVFLAAPAESWMTKLSSGTPKPDPWEAPVNPREGHLDAEGTLIVPAGGDPAMEWDELAPAFWRLTRQICPTCDWSGTRVVAVNGQLNGGGRVLADLAVDEHGRAVTVYGQRVKALEPVLLPQLAEQLREVAVALSQGHPPPSLAQLIQEMAQSDDPMAVTLLGLQRLARLTNDPAVLQSEIARRFSRIGQVVLSREVLEAIMESARMAPQDEACGP